MLVSGMLVNLCSWPRQWLDGSLCDNYLLNNATMWCALPIFFSSQHCRSGCLRGFAPVTVWLWPHLPAYFTVLGLCHLKLGNKDINFFKNKNKNQHCRVYLNRVSNTPNLPRRIVLTCGWRMDLGVRKVRPGGPIQVRCRDGGRAPPGQKQQGVGEVGRSEECWGHGVNWG